MKKTNSSYRAFPLFTEIRNLLIWPKMRKTITETSLAMHIPKTTTSLRNRTEILITHPLLIGLENCWISTTFRILDFMTWGICVKKTIGEKHSNTDYSESDFWFFLNSLPPCSDIFHLYINLFIKNLQEKKTHTNWCFFSIIYPTTSFTCGE